ncbi:MAG: PEP-CTERM sorting domain-containing protein, partial [Verrucomicrobiota bacterium]
GFNLSGQLDLVVYYANANDSSNTDWSSSFSNYAVLRDSSWTVPSFSLNPSLTAITFSTNTQALVGSINAPTSAGATSITLVPEPSTYALMALGGLVLFFMVRRRKVQA